MHYPTVHALQPGVQTLPQFKAATTVASAVAG
jgi:hypothetical protein